MAAGLDMFYLFVENVFGGVFISVIGFLMIFILIGMTTRMSIQLLVMLCGLFIMTVAIGFVGLSAAFLFGLIGFLYLFQGIINLVLSMRV